MAGALGLSFPVATPNHNPWTMPWNHHVWRQHSKQCTAESIFWKEAEFCLPKPSWDTVEVTVPLGTAAALRCQVPPSPALCWGNRAWGTPG